MRAIWSSASSTKPRNLARMLWQAPRRASVRARTADRSVMDRPDRMSCARSASRSTSEGACARSRGGAGRRGTKTASVLRRASRLQSSDGGLRVLGRKVFEIEHRPVTQSLVRPPSPARLRPCGRSIHRRRRWLQRRRRRRGRGRGRWRRRWWRRRRSWRRQRRLSGGRCRRRSRHGGGERGGALGRRHALKGGLRGAIVVVLQSNVKDGTGGWGRGGVSAAPSAAAALPWWSR